MSDHDRDHQPLGDDLWPSGPIPRPADSVSTPAPATQKRQGGRISDLLLVGLIALIVGAGGTAAGLLGTDIFNERVNDAASAIVDDAIAELDLSPVVQTAPPVQVQMPLDPQLFDSELGQIAAQALPSVVRVVVSVDTGRVDENGDPQFEPIGTGSGIGYTTDGKLFTNNHVIADADLIQVELVDGRVYEAELVGTDPLTDVAVIQIPPGLVPALPLGDMENLAIGDTAIAVGNPLGLEGGPSVTTGIISAFGRQLNIEGRTSPLQGLIQTDAPISGGSSGGALLDDTGRLIGMTTAKSVGDSAEGLGFAIPMDLASSIADDLIANGTINHPFLGIWGGTAYSELADGATQPSGAEIIRLIDGTDPEDPISDSSFGNAGALPEDVIVSFDGNEIRTMNQLATLMRFYRAGDTVVVTVLRGGEPLDLEVTLAARPEGT